MSFELTEDGIVQRPTFVGRERRRFPRSLAAKLIDQATTQSDAERAAIARKAEVRA